MQFIKGFNYHHLHHHHISEILDMSQTGASEFNALAKIKKV